MKQEGFNPKPINIDQGPNPYKAETAKKESLELTKDIERRILEAEAYVKDHPEEEARYRLLINDMKDEVAERKLVEEYSDEDKLKTGEKLDLKALELFSGKKQHPDILQ